MPAMLERLHGEDPAGDRAAQAAEPALGGEVVAPVAQTRGSH